MPESCLAVCSFCFDLVIEPAAAGYLAVWQIILHARAVALRRSRMLKKKIHKKCLQRKVNQKEHKEST